MEKQFSLVQLFSLVDGRLSTNMNDVYDMLNHITNSDLTTIALPIAYERLKSINPQWFQDVQNIYNTLGISKDRDFQECIGILNRNNQLINVSQL